MIAGFDLHFHEQLIVPIECRSVIRHSNLPIAYLQEKSPVTRRQIILKNFDELLLLQ
jgi:hypothetical protein